jgi:hypothetical protein
MHPVSEVSESFEDLSHALRVLLEAHLRAYRQGLLQVDRAEAVGNIETGLASVLNGFHSLFDALSKGDVAGLVNWYRTPELATILVVCKKSAERKRQRFRNTKGWHERRSRPCVRRP